MAIRATPAAASYTLLSDTLRALADTVWRVNRDSDRTGVRLDPADDEPPAALRGVPGIAPEGTTLGAIQVPPDGRPIVLGPDRPVTGGYAKPAVVAVADGRARVIVRRETIDDLLALDVDEP